MFRGRQCNRLKHIHGLLDEHRLNQQLQWVQNS
jgi:hypothetical protein